MYRPSQASTRSDPVRAHERPELLVVCAILGIVGTLAPVVLMVVASVFAEHDMIADTISDLGRGPHKWIMDLGFYLSAAGLLALSIGAAHAHIGRTGWSLGIFTLAFIALTVVLLGLWDEIHTAPSDPEALTVHTRLTYVLGPLYLIGPLLMATAIGRVSRGLSLSFVAASILWAVFITAFKLASDGVDGAMEKLAFAATMLWTLPLALVLLGRGLHATGRALRPAHDARDA